MKIFSNSITSLEHGLNYAVLQQKAIANNIANADTPNYKAKEASFKKVLEEASTGLEAKRTEPRHFQFESKGNGLGHILKTKAMSYNNNGNSVDMDKEMSDLAANQIYYNALTDRLSSKFTSLSNVIKGGR